MTSETPTVRCPYCMGERVQPYGEAWRCLDCLKVFDQAAVQMPPPETGKEKPK
jgi:ribosomal protein L37AE/L43A